MGFNHYNYGNVALPGNTLSGSNLGTQKYPAQIWGEVYSRLENNNFYFPRENTKLNNSRRKWGGIRKRIGQRREKNEKFIDSLDADETEDNKNESNLDVMKPNPNDETQWTMSWLSSLSKEEVQMLDQKKLLKYLMEGMDKDIVNMSESDLERDDIKSKRLYTIIIIIHHIINDSK